MNKNKNAHKYNEEWRTNLDEHSIQSRIYTDKYIESKEEYNDIQVIVFRLENGTYVIFVDYYNVITGVTYVTKDDVYKVKEEIKKDLKEKDKGRINSDSSFINYFIKKYDIKEVPPHFFETNYEIDEQDANDCKLNDKEIKCSSNTKNNKIAFLIPILSIISLSLFSNIITNIYLDKEFTITTLFCFIKNFDMNTILLLLIIMVLYVIWFLRIKNFELLIKGEKIIYKNLLGIKQEYNFSEIKYYKKIISTEYYDSDRVKKSGSITILLRLNKKRIWLFGGDSNLFELLNYLNDKKIVQKKALRT